ncbi:MAG: response regulator [Thermodesulfobacteriota bacterium]|nr:response regulator [Thermodesulfobacteriota bacterium]
MTQENFQVLVLDDEVSIQQSIAAYFEDEGFAVFCASSGEQALELVKKHRFNGAVADIRLPGMDGNTFMLKAARLQSDIHFVVHTGSTDYSLSRELRAAGVSSRNVFIKPVHDLSILVNALKNNAPGI